jgi:hypothetical protein
VKAVQIGILVALILVAGLLGYIAWHDHGSQPAETAAVVPAQAPPDANASAPEPSVAPLTPADENPSPAARVHKKGTAAIAQNTPPPSPPVEAAPAQPVQEAPAQPVQEAAPPAPSKPVETPVVAPPPPPPPPPAHSVTIADGTIFNVRLVESISSDKNQPGDTFHATMDQPLIVDGMVLAERGAQLEGKVVQSQKAGRVKGVSDIELQLVRLHLSDGQAIAIQTAIFEKEGPTSHKSDAEKIGGGAALGAIIGAIAGGGKGAAIGAGAGGAAGGGVVMATRGKPVNFPSESKLSFRLANPVTVTEKRQ